MAKRAIDLVIAGAALLMLAPAFALVALLVKLDSEGPIFFKQERIGRGFRPFLIYKFRTMIKHAPKLGPAITVGQDTRITRVGRLLRRTKIDELPQLINVLKGEMSLVGPRPELPQYVKAFHHEYEEILSVRPGITDLASLEFIDEASVLAHASDPERAYCERVLPQKLALASQYVREHSLRMDGLLIARTLWTIPTAMMWPFLIKSRRAIMVALHLLMVVACYYLAFLLRFDGGIRDADWRIFIRMLPLVASVELLVFIPYGLYRGLWRYIGIDDLRKIIDATLVGSSITYVLIEWVLRIESYPRSIYAINALLLIVVLGGARMGRRIYHELGSLEAAARRVLIIGAGDAGEMIVRDMLNNPFYNLQPIGFIDDDRTKVGRTIHNLPVWGTRRDLPAIIESCSPDEILVAIYRTDPRLLREIVRSLDSYKLPIKILPSLRDMINGSVTVSQIRNVSLEDLLQRGPVGLDPEPLRRVLEGRRVLVTGAGGSIGSELCRQVSKLDIGLLMLFERYENALYTIEGDLRNRGATCKIVPLIGDVTDAERVRAVFEEFRPEVVIHAAAHKHVPLVQQNPCEAVKNNVRGTRIVAETAARHGTGRFILISTDKAVQPSSVMGATKYLSELLVRLISLRNSTCFATVRFGNVLGSNGSVIPKFLEQIKLGGPVTVTHPEVERFFMTIPEAVNLVLHSASLNESGALYVLDMGTPVKIVDMACHLIRLSGLVPHEDVRIEFTGLRPGEKLREELLNPGEQAERSSIPQVVKVVRPALHDPDALYRDVLRLENLAAIGDHQRVLDMLGELVGGFRTAPGIADEMTSPIDIEPKLVAASS